MVLTIHFAFKLRNGLLTHCCHMTSMYTCLNVFFALDMKCERKTKNNNKKRAMFTICSTIGISMCVTFREYSA